MQSEKGIQKIQRAIKCCSAWTTCGPVVCLHILVFGCPEKDVRFFQGIIKTFKDCFKNIFGELKFNMPDALQKKTLLLSARQIFGTVGGANGPLFFENHVIDKTFCFFIAIRVPPDLMKPFSGSDTPPSPENPGFHEIRRLFTLPVLS